MYHHLKSLFGSTRLDRVALALIGIAFAIRLIIACLPVTALAVWFVPDDSFYYFKISQHVATGVGSTFDGEHLTNGYHPLWMLIVAGSMALFGGLGEMAPVHAALILSAILDTATLVLVYAIARKIFAHPAPRIAVLILVALSPVQIGWAVNGLETSLAGLLAVTLAAFPIFYGAGRWPLRRLVIWGVLGGLMILARTDYGLYPFLLSLWYLWRNRTEFLRTALALALPAILVVLPWVLWSWSAVGTPVQESGLALTHTNRELFSYKPREVGTLILWSAYQFLLALKMAIEQTGVAALTIATALVVAVRVALRRSYIAQIRASVTSDTAQVAWVLVAASFLLIVVHGALRWTPRDWYFIAPAILMTFLMVAGLRSLLESAPRRTLAMLGVIVAALFILTAVEIYPKHPAARDMVATAYWLRDNTPADARIAAFNSGIYGYLSQRYVLNSDGLVSHDTFRAIRNRELLAFWQRTGITHFLDFDIARTYRYRTFFGVPEIERYLNEVTTRSAPDSGYHGSQLRFYTVDYAPPMIR